MNTRHKIDLDPEDIPRYYYNILADLPEPMAPPLNPITKKPVGPQDLAPLFPIELIKQEVSTERYIPIPEEVRELYGRYRPTPVYRAERLEEYLGTSAKILYKYEGVSPAGSHKVNTALPQAYYNAKEGITALTTETGAGQWGTALAYATSFFDLDLEVYMVRISYDGKPYRKTMMRLFNPRAKVVASPSGTTEYGKQTLEENPNHPGSLGVAIGEAIERAVTTGAKYSLGSVLNHVLLHQTIIGQEAKQQLASVDLVPNTIIGCVGGGSNFSGLAYPFLADTLKNKNDIDYIAIESMAAPKMTHGKVQYDYGDSGKMTPLLQMHTIGSDFVPPPIHAGGLRYHGLAPSLSLLLANGYIRAMALQQTEVFQAAHLFTQMEGIVPAPESSHAIAQAIREARSTPPGEEKVILFNLSGHGYLDLQGYEEYLNGSLADSSASMNQISAALNKVQQIAAD